MAQDMSFSTSIYFQNNVALSQTLFSKVIYTSWKKKVKGNPFEFSKTFENIKIIMQSISKVQLEHEKNILLLLFLPWKKVKISKNIVACRKIVKVNGIPY